MSNSLIKDVMNFYDTFIQISPMIFRKGRASNWVSLPYNLCQVVGLIAAITESIQRNLH